MHVVMIRHGSTVFNEAGCYQGVLDEPLSEAGRKALCAPHGDSFSELCMTPVYEGEPSAHASLSLHVRDLSRIYVSPLRRARQTASILFPGVPQIAVDGFREMNFGVFEGRSADSMANDAQYRAWVDAMCEPAPPEGESRREFYARVCDAFAHLMGEAFDFGSDSASASDPDSDSDFDPLVIVAHGGTIMAALEKFAHPSRSYYGWMCPLGCGYVLQTTGERWRSDRKLDLVGPIAFVRQTNDLREKADRR